MAAAAAAARAAAAAARAAARAASGAARAAAQPAAAAGGGSRAAAATASAPRLTTISLHRGGVGLKSLRTLSSSSKTPQEEEGFMKAMEFAKNLKDVFERGSVSEQAETLKKLSEKLAKLDLKVSGAIWGFGLLAAVIMAFPAMVYSVTYEVEEMKKSQNDTKQEIQRLLRRLLKLEFQVSKGDLMEIDDDTEEESSEPTESTWLLRRWIQKLWGGEDVKSGPSGPEEGRD